LTVLFITHKYPPAVGGMETQSYHLISGISEMITAYHIIFDSKEPIWKFFFRLRWRVKKMLNAHPEITHIHLNDGLMTAFCYLLRVDFHGRKVVATFHGLDVVFPLGIYQNYIFKRMISKVNKIICVSSATREACLARNISKEMLSVVNNGVDIKMINPILDEKVDIIKRLNVDLSSDRIIIILGRPVKRKGFSWFANLVMPLLGNNIKLVHIGQVSFKGTSFLYNLIPKSWENKFNLFMGKADDSDALHAAHRRNPKKVILAGKISNEERDCLIKSASLVVMPNIEVVGDMEGFGLVALEAAVMGKTVLVSDLEGMKDAIIDGKNGYRITTGSAQLWANAINRYIENNELLSEEIRAFTIQNYSWEKMCLGYLDEMIRV